MIQITLISAITATVAAAVSAYLGMSAIRTQSLQDTMNRLSGYHDVMSYMIEDVDYTGAARIAQLMGADAEIGDFEVINRFDKTVVSHGDVTANKPSWQLVELDIVDRNGIQLAHATYQIRNPVIAQPELLRILGLSLGVGAAFALFAFLLFARLRTRLLGPIRRLHRDVASGSALQTPRPDTPLEVVELSNAIGNAFDRAEEAAARNLQHIEVLTQVLSNFGVAIRYVDSDGKSWDYGRIDAHILPPCDTPPRQARLGPLIATLRDNLTKTFDTTEVDLQTRAHDGAALQLECSDRGRIHELTLFDLGHGDFAISLADITRAREMEASALEAQKMDVLGQLSSGIAHDLNNILGVIIGSAELLLIKFPDPKLQQYITPVTSACERGASLTRSLLSFARKASLEAEVIDLNRMVNGLTSWAARVMPENIATEVILQGAAWPVRADPAMTESALLNLMLNARDAMPDGGRLTIETANLIVDDQYLAERGETIRPGYYTMLAVSDTGIGIHRERMKAIFEPFYTTKGPDHGSGLGLSMIYGFMRQSGGLVRVYSEENVGTTFKLFFPSSDKPEDRRPRRDLPIQTTAGAQILLVEDEEELRFSLAEHLRLAGYNVTVAQNGDEALDLFMRERFCDVVVTDIVMPGTFSGVTLVHKLREIDPTLCSVFISGYPQEAAMHGNGLRPEDIRLMKPVRRDNLIAAVEKALAQKRERGS